MLVKNNNEGYVSKFASEFMLVHPDFISSSVTMTAQTTTSYIILSSSITALSSATTDAVSDSTSSYLNLNVFFQSNSVYTLNSDVWIQPISQSFLALVENNDYSLTLNLPCSLTGATSILYSPANSNGFEFHSWVILDASTKELKISTPSVISQSKTFQFYVNSTTIDASNPLQTLIILQVNKWNVNNCQKWSSSNTMSWSIFNPIEVPLNKVSTAVSLFKILLI